MKIARMVIDGGKITALDYAKRMALFGAALLLTACGVTQSAKPDAPSQPNSPPSTESQTPVKHLQTGLASFYGKDFHGRTTANGEIFNMNEMVAAHPSYRFGTRLRVTNLDNKKIVEVRVNDRGPASKYQAEGVIIDLSHGAAAKLAMLSRGRVPVKVEVLEWGGQSRSSRG